MEDDSVSTEATFVLNDRKWLVVRVRGERVDVWREDAVVAEGVDRRLLDPQVVLPLPNAGGMVGIGLDYRGELSASHDGHALRRVGERADAPTDLLRPRRWLLVLAAIQWLPFLFPVGPFAGTEVASAEGFLTAVVSGIALIPYIAPSFAFFAFGWFGLVHLAGTWMVLTHPDARVGDFLMRGAIAGLLLGGWNVSWRHHRRAVALRRSYERPSTSPVTSSWWNDA